MKLDINEVPNVCRYCRQIMKQPDYPKTLELYRGEMLCLTVDVEGASKLLLVENDKIGPIHVPYDEEKARRRLEGLRKTTTSGVRSDLNEVGGTLLAERV